MSAEVEYGVGGRGDCDTLAKAELKLVESCDNAID